MTSPIGAVLPEWARVELDRLRRYGPPLDDTKASAMLGTLAVWHRAHDPARYPCRCGTFNGVWDDKPCALDAIPLSLLRSIDVGWRP